MKIPRWSYPKPKNTHPILSEMVPYVLNLGFMEMNFKNIWGQKNKLKK